MSEPLVSVVIPTRRGESVDVTMRALMAQTHQHLEIVTVVDHEGRGAPWARNRGAELARGQYLLFSDNDIDWDADAIACMVEVLATNAGRDIKDGWRVGYAYGGYEMGGARYCMEPWNLRILMGRNQVSTMSLMPRDVFPGFDESLKRLQDWELWLRLALERKLLGWWVGRVLFRTEVRKGISFDGRCGYEEAWAMVRRKHGLPV